MGQVRADEDIAASYTRTGSLRLEQTLVSVGGCGLFQCVNCRLTGGSSPTGYVQGPGQYAIRFVRASANIRVASHPGG